MKHDFDFQVGQTVRFNKITNTTHDDGRGDSHPYQYIDRAIGTIVAIHEDNKRKLEIKEKETGKHFRLVPRNVIEIIPADCVILSAEEKLAKEVGMFQFNIGQIKYLSNFGKDELMRHLKAINELFAARNINSWWETNEHK